MLKKIFSASFFELLTLLVPLLILPLLAAKANVTEMADYLFILLLIMTSQQVVDYSYTYIAGRMNKTELLNCFNDIFSAKIILCLFSTTISILLTFIFVKNISSSLLFAVVLGCINSLFGSQWLYISTGSYERFNILNMPSKMVVFVTILGFPSMYGFGTFMLLNSILVFMCSFIMFFYKCRQIQLVGFSFDLGAAKKNLKINYHLFVADFIPQLYVTAPLIFFRGGWNDASYVALSVAYRFYNAGMTAQWSSLKVSIAENKIFSQDNIKKVFMYTFFFAVLKIFGVFFIASYLLDYMFNEKGIEILLYLKVLSIGFIGAALYIAFGYSVAILNKSESSFKSIAFYLSLPAVVIVYLCSYQYGVLGYAIAVVLARFMTGIYFYFHYKRMVANL